MNLSQKKIWKSKVDKNEEIIWDRRFWLIVYIVSDNELLKLLVETSAKQQQISLEKQDSSSDILLRILEQTVEEETLLSIADTRRIQEESRLESQRKHNDLLVRVLDQLSPESGPIQREKWTLICILSFTSIAGLRHVHIIFVYQWRSLWTGFIFFVVE